MFRNQPQCRCFANAVRGPSAGWTLENACSVCNDTEDSRWLCLGCYQIFCGSKTEGHMHEHCEATSSTDTQCCVAISITKKTFWCFKCKTSDFATQHDTRLQMAFGLVMSRSAHEVESLAAVLRRLYRRGLPNPRCWADLPLHRQQVFGSRAKVNLDGLVNKWQNTLNGKLSGEDACGKRIIVMAGAGISVSAGIPDFRTPGSGLYYNLQSYKLGRPEDMFSMDFFKKNPYPFYHFAKHLWPTGQHRPTPTHYFVRLLQEKGLLHRMYTQNIDGLERLAGVKDENLVEAHGTFSTASCIKCRSVVDPIQVRDAILAGNVPVMCDVCSSNTKFDPSIVAQDVGLIKPDIVFFGESLPRRFHTLMQSDFETCDLLIVMGTSLKVAPFNRLVSDVPDTTVRLLVNREKQPGAGSDPMVFDGDCAYRDIWMESDCDSGVEKIVDMMGWRREFDDLLKEREKVVDITKPTPAPTVATSASDTSTDHTTTSRRSSDRSSPGEPADDRVMASSGRMRKVKFYDMKTGQGVDPGRFASVLATNATPKQRAEYQARVVEKQKQSARSRIQKAMYGGGRRDLEEALKAGKEAGLTRWELEPGQEVLKHLDEKLPKMRASVPDTLTEKDTRRFQSAAARMAQEDDADLLKSSKRFVTSFTRSLSNLAGESTDDSEGGWDEEVKAQVNKCQDRLKQAIKEESITLIEQELLVAEGLGVPWIDTVDARKELVLLQKRRSEMHSRKSSQGSDGRKGSALEKQSTIDINSPERCDLVWCTIPGCLEAHTHVAAWHVCEMCGYVGHSCEECGMEDGELEELRVCRSKESMPEDQQCSIQGCQNRQFHSSEGHLCRVCRLRGHPVKLCPTWVARAFN